MKLLRLTLVLVSTRSLGLATTDKEDANRGPSNAKDLGLCLLNRVAYSFMGASPSMYTLSPVVLVSPRRTDVRAGYSNFLFKGVDGLAREARSIQSA